MKKIETLISAEKLEIVKKALSQTFNTDLIHEITLLTGGFSSSPVYKIIIAEQSYVLKLSPGTEVADEDSLSCMEIAAAGGIAPPVLYLNKGDGLMIMPFIKSTPIHTAFKSTELLLQKLGKTIKDLHQLPLFAKEEDLKNTINGFVSEFKASGMLFGSIFDECFEYYDLVNKHYPWNDPDRVSSHNDLNPNNLIYDGNKIWIIDWDAAFKNDRYVDLAILANFYVSNDEQEDAFLKAYFGNDLNDYHRARFFIMRQICRIVYSMLMFKLAHGSKPGNTTHDSNMEDISLTVVKQQLGKGQISLASYQGQLLFGKALFIEALNCMRLPLFASSIQLL